MPTRISISPDDQSRASSNRPRTKGMPFSNRVVRRNTRSLTAGQFIPVYHVPYSSNVTPSVIAKRGFNLAVYTVPPLGVSLVSQERNENAKLLAQPRRTLVRVASVFPPLLYEFASSKCNLRAVNFSFLSFCSSRIELEPRIESAKFRSRFAYPEIGNSMADCGC